MSQHGRRRAAPALEPTRRYAGLSVETMVVLGLIVAIIAGSFVANAVLPSERETHVLVGDKKVRVTEVGSGGVLPGPIQPRTVPVAVPAPAATPTPTPAPKKKKKKKKVAPTPTPTPTPTPQPGALPLPGDTGGEECLLLLCPTPSTAPDPTPAPPPDPAQPTVAPTPAATPDPDAEQPPIPQ